MMFTARKIKGFTIIEVLLVVAIISLISIPLLINYRSSRTNQALLASTDRVVDTLRTAHVFARDARDKSSWGVRNISNTRYELYSENMSGSTREQDYILENGVFFMENFDIQFNIGTGEADSKYTIKLQATNGSKRHIEVLKTGVVENFRP